MAAPIAVATGPSAKQYVHQEKTTPSPGVSLVSGGIAGGIEGFITYPFDFAKTSVQLRNDYASSNPLRVIWGVVRTQGVSALYTGCSSLVVGAMGKAGVRFLCFDTIKARLADESGNVTLARGIFAGMLAGTAESLVAVTPTERIKTALVDDAKGARRFRGGVHAISTLVRENGLSELYRGCAATTIKQASTSAVRMGSYNILKQYSRALDLSQNAAMTFMLGAVAGTITVYATQPFDTVKTRSQAAAGTSPVNALRSVLQDGGIRGLWKGSTMRLGRLVLSGGIIFSMYEQISSLLTSYGL